MSETIVEPRLAHLALVGMAGVGKSALARRLGQRLGRSVIDLDARVVHLAGRPIEAIFESDGEEAFRDLETQALRAALEAPGPCVIATGGGVVERTENRRLLAHDGVVVWLHAPDAVIVERLRTSSVKRPLLAGDLAANVAELRSRREDRYREVADLDVDLGSLSLPEAHQRLIDALGRRWPQLIGGSS